MQPIISLGLAPSRSKTSALAMAPVASAMAEPRHYTRDLQAARKKGEYVAEAIQDPVSAALFRRCIDEIWESGFAEVAYTYLMTSFVHPDAFLTPDQSKGYAAMGFTPEKILEISRNGDGTLTRMMRLGEEIRRECASKGLPVEQFYSDCGTAFGLIDGDKPNAPSEIVVDLMAAAIEYPLAVVAASQCAEVFCPPTVNDCTRFAIWDMTEQVIGNYDARLRQAKKYGSVTENDRLTNFARFCRKNKLSVLAEDGIHLHLLERAKFYAAMEPNDIAFCRQYPRIVSPFVHQLEQIRTLSGICSEHEARASEKERTPFERDCIVNTRKFLTRLSQETMKLQGWRAPEFIDALLSLIDRNGGRAVDPEIIRRAYQHNAGGLVELRYYEDLSPEILAPDPMELLGRVAKSQEQFIAVLRHGGSAIAKGRWAEFAVFVQTCSSKTSTWTDAWNRASEEGRTDVLDVMFRLSRNRESCKSGQLANIMKALEDFPLLESLAHLEDRALLATFTTKPKPAPKTPREERRVDAQNVDTGVLAIAKRSLPETFVSTVADRANAERIFEVALNVARISQYRTTFLEAATGAPETILDAIESALETTPRNPFRVIVQMLREMQATNTPSRETVGLSDMDLAEIERHTVQKALKLNPTHIYIVSGDLRATDTLVKFREALDTNLFTLIPMPSEAGSRPVKYSFPKGSRPFVLWHLRMSRHKQSEASLRDVRNAGGAQRPVLSEEGRLLRLAQQIQTELARVVAENLEGELPRHESAA